MGKKSNSKVFSFILFENCRKNQPKSKVKNFYLILSLLFVFFRGITLYIELKSFDAKSNDSEHFETLFRTLENRKSSFRLDFHKFFSVKFDYNRTNFSEVFYTRWTFSPKIFQLSA